MGGVRQAISNFILGLSIAWFGFGFASWFIILLGNLFSTGMADAWKDPGATMLLNFAIPAAIGVVIAKIVGSAGRCYDLP